MAIPENSAKIIRDEDTDLVQAINAGDGRLFGRLVEKYQHRLFNFGLRMCGEVRDAEDLVQDTFLNVFRYLGAFRYETRFKNWLYRIAATTCLKKRRKSKHAPDREISLEEFLPAEGVPAPGEVPEWARLPLEQVLNGELNHALGAAILDLPKKYRMVVVLRDMEGFSTAETSHILGISETNAKVRLHRARLFLREKLKGYFDHGSP